VNLYKTSAYTSVATAISFISGFIVTKVVAVKIGPSGMAYLGQFQNTTAILLMLATGAIGTGVIKYLAENRSDPAKAKSIINTSVVVVLICSIAISLFVFISSKYLSIAAFKTSDFWIVYFLFGIFVFTLSFNGLFSAILNGLNKVKNLTIVNITGSLAGVAFTVLFAYYFGVKGVLLSSSAVSLIIFFIYVYFFRKFGITWWPDFKKFDKSVFKLLSGFTLMAMVSGFLVPAMQIFVRDKIITDFSVSEAGYWQAVTKISDYYLSFITLVLGVYYIPKLSEIQDKSLLRKEILNGYKMVMPAVTILALVIWLARGLVIDVLFTPAFLPMKPLFTFQLLGDVLKIGSWLLASLMISKAMTKNYIITEFIFAATYVLFSYFFINQFGIIGATYGFCCNYALYWIVMWLMMKNKI
jgi:O-antigen/teichoic acid export membrane protein